MFSTKSLSLTGTALSLIASTSAVYSSGATSNLAVYWGQGSSQARLITYCQDPNIDIIPLAFIDAFLAQADGYLGSSFLGESCQKVYSGPGYPTSAQHDASADALANCPSLAEEIYMCQNVYNTKIVLSLGGENGPYGIANDQEATDLADFLWGAYGPYTSEWTGPRPLDAADAGNTANGAIRNSLDGFDFDIETLPGVPYIRGPETSYIKCINRLREHFKEDTSKQYLITAAPQSPPPAVGWPTTGTQSATIINGAQFDMIFIQFYNNAWDGSTARFWLDANPDYTGGTPATSTFSYPQWVDFISLGASSNAKLYIGLLADNSSASGDYLAPAEVKSLLSYWQVAQAENFGGVMLWDAGSAGNNIDSAGRNYYQAVKTILNNNKPVPTTLPACPTKVAVAPGPTQTGIVSNCILWAQAMVAGEGCQAFCDENGITLEELYEWNTGLGPYTTGQCTGPFWAGEYYCVQTQYPCSSTTSSSSTTPTPTPTPSTSSTKTPTPTPTPSTSSTTTPTPTPTLSTSSTPTPTPTPSSSSTSLSSSTPTPTPSPSSSSTSTTPSNSSTVTPTPTPTPSSSSSSTSTIETPTPTPTPSSSSETIEGTSSTPSPTPTPSPSSSSSTETPTTDIPTYTPTLSATPTPSPTDSSSTSAAASSSSCSETPTPTPSSAASSTSSSESDSTPTPTPTPSSAASSTSSSETEVTPTPTPTPSSSPSSTSTSSSLETPTSSPSSAPSSSTSATDSVSTSSSPSSSTTPSSAPSSSSPTPSGSAAASSTSSSTQFTTSTVYTTSVYTVTSCAPTVTDCPGRIGQVTTDIISLYTTICPVTETETSTSAGVATSSPTTTSVPSTTQYTTSTVYATSVYTVTSCAPTVTNCPALIGQVTTEIVKLYTTVCPIEEASQTYTAFPTSTLPGGAFVAASSSAPVGVEGESSTVLTTTLKSTTTQYSTVHLVQTTQTIYPVPVTTLISSVAAPYPTGPASSGKVCAGGFACIIGTGAPSASLVYSTIKVVPTPAAPSSAEGVVTKPSASAVPTQFTGSASGLRVGGWVAVVVAAMGALMI